MLFFVPNIPCQNLIYLQHLKKTISATKESIFISELSLLQQYIKKRFAKVSWGKFS